jgi:hypothetical protein
VRPVDRRTRSYGSRLLIGKPGRSGMGGNPAEAHVIQDNILPGNVVDGIDAIDVMRVRAIIRLVKRLEDAYMLDAIEVLFFAIRPGQNFRMRWHLQLNSYLAKFFDRHGLFLSVGKLIAVSKLE